MREVTAVLSKQLTVGLRPEKLGPHAGAALTELVNLLPTGLGLVRRDEYVNPVVDAPVAAYPFPALRVTVADVLIASPEGTWVADGTWSLDAITGTPAEWEDVPHVADFTDFYVACAPGGVVLGGFRDDGVRTSTQSPVTQADTCCAFRGQLLIGAPRSYSILRSFTDPDALKPLPPIGDNIIAWSRIGAMDFSVGIDNEIGWAVLPWRGKVLRMLELSGAIMAYCENGIARLQPESTPIVTFGLDSIADFGILNRNAVDGDDQMHLAIGRDYALYTLTPERKVTQEGRGPKRLGYAEYMKQLENPQVVHDPVHQRWWIFDGSKCFVWSSFGLAEVTNVPKSLTSFSGSLIGIGEDGVEAVILCSDELTFGTAGMKTLQTVEVDAAGGAYSMQVDFKTDTDANWRTSSWIPCSPNGLAFPTVTGRAFRVRIRCDSLDAEIGQINVRYKLSDKRSVRGIVYAGSTDRGTD